MAAGTASVDTMLADAIKKMDALGARMDALETGTGSKNPITKGDDDDDDKKKRDDKSAKADDDDDKRHRGDDDDDKKKRDDKSAKADDDDDDKKKDDAKTPKNRILDDRAKRGDDGELEIKHGKGKDDSARKADDDDDDKKKDDAKKPPFAKGDDDDRKRDDDDDDRKRDDDDDRKRDDTARADAAETRRLLREQSDQIKRLESLLKPRSDDEHAAFADAQARADAVYNGFGLRAPRPLEGEGLVDYRRRLAAKLKMHSPVWKDVKLSQLPDTAFGIAETAIYSDAEGAASRPIDLQPGELRMVTKIDPVTGGRVNVFYGQEHFTKAMGRPGRRIKSFNTQASR